MVRKTKLIIASNNQGKIREFKQLLEPLGYDVMSQSEAGICIDVEETGNTFEENARLKARAIFELSGAPVIADDSGLVVDYLGGEPGIYSARYASMQNPATELSANDIILKKLDGVSRDKRTARFVCCICYVDNSGETVVSGVCDGYIGYEFRGENGFGYDPIFMIGDKSFAEISDEEKNAVSHRGKALRELIKIF